MTELEMVYLYRGYVTSRDSCIAGQRYDSERLENHDNFYRAVFVCNAVTCEQVERAASDFSKAIATKLFNAMFETQSDRLVFCLKCSPSQPVWVQNGNNKLFGSLDINGGETVDDKPMRIFVMEDAVQLTWGRDYIADRDRAFGPAIVDIKADKSFVGHHVMAHARVAGFSNWRKRCAKHNLWMAYLQQ